MVPALLSGHHHSVTGRGGHRILMATAAVGLGQCRKHCIKPLISEDPVPVACGLSYSLTAFCEVTSSSMYNPQNTGAELLIKEQVRD